MTDDVDAEIVDDDAVDWSVDGVVKSILTLYVISNSPVDEALDEVDEGGDVVVVADKSSSQLFGWHRIEIPKISPEIEMEREWLFSFNVVQNIVINFQSKSLKWTVLMTALEIVFVKIGKIINYFPSQPILFLREGMERNSICLWVLWPSYTE